MRGNVTIFRARRIVTLDTGMPVADAVAVMDGRILHTGSFGDIRDDLTGWDVSVDDRFGDMVIVPGFVEAHCHALQEGSLASYPWVGSYDRRGADGSVRSGCPDTASAISRVLEAHLETAQSGEPLACMGWDPNMAGGAPITRAMLDTVSAERPIFVMESNGHVGHCNSAMMRLAGITRDTDAHGMTRDAQGEPTGELKEMSLTLVLGRHVRTTVDTETAARNFGVLARQVGCTTATDLAFGATTRAVTEYAAAVNRDDFPVRVAYAPMVQSLEQRFGDSLPGHISSLREHDSLRFRMGPVKFTIDGSIQGRSARMDWPGYCCGDPNGIWLAEPDEMFEKMLPYHRAGYQLAMHTNGDEAVNGGLDVYERLLLEHPRFDHRHRLEHAQLATEEAFVRMKALGVSVNLFANHVWYWGDTHRTDTAGPAKARRLDACGTAARLGVPFSIHCDAPVTPLDPLFTMWCAVNRFTSGGHLLGESERISAEQALRAMTIDAAYLLKMDHQVGSLVVGKQADMAVLADDPTTVDPAAIKDIAVHATVSGGHVHEN
ncbi:MAG: amidohydrolase [Ilumatobacteraceae bacterium]